MDLERPGEEGRVATALSHALPVTEWLGRAPRPRLRRARTTRTALLTLAVATSSLDFLGG